MAKIMMGSILKTDKLDAHDLATLLYLGKLPSVWIPPAAVRQIAEATQWVLTESAPKMGPWRSAS